MDCKSFLAKVSPGQVGEGRWGRIWEDMDGKQNQRIFTVFFPRNRKKIKSKEESSHWERNPNRLKCASFECLF